MTVRVLFDADSMVYGCGFASQKVVYDYVLSEDQGDGIVEGIALSREELAATVAMLPDGWSISYNSLAEAEPLENALALCKRQIVRVEEDLARMGYDFSRLELFLTGKGNFRDAVAVTKPYKGNRIAMEKPIHYKAIRRYLRNRWGAVVVDGREADDEVAIISASLDHDPDKVIIVSQDKDLLTVPGLLYNYRKREMQLVTHKAALVAFYRQMLTGDTVDNIGGCFRVGEAKAAILIHEGMNEHEMYKTVLKQFEKSKGLKGCPYADRDAAEVVLEHGRLLHMLRTPEDVWIPPVKND